MTGTGEGWFIPFPVPTSWTLGHTALCLPGMGLSARGPRRVQASATVYARVAMCLGIHGPGLSLAKPGKTTSLFESGLMHLQREKARPEYRLGSSDTTPMPQEF